MRAGSFASTPAARPFRPPRERGWGTQTPQTLVVTQHCRYWHVICTICSGSAQAAILTVGWFEGLVGVWQVV